MHRQADGGQINWQNENLRRHGMLEKPGEGSKGMAAELAEQVKERVKGEVKGEDKVKTRAKKKAGDE